MSEDTYAMAVDNNGEVHVAGFGYRSATYRDALVIKYESDGDTAWVRYYDGGQEFYDDFLAVAVDDSGNTYVSGRCMESDNQFDIITIKYNSAGTAQWVSRYDGPAHDDDEAFDMAIDDEGCIYVTGTTLNSSTYRDWITIKYNNTGDTVWTAVRDGGENGMDFAEALVLDDSGNVYVTGYVFSWSSYYDIATVKYNTSGAEQWVVKYDGTASGADDRGYDVAYANGYVSVTGESEGLTTDADYITVKYSTAGDTIWEMRYDGPGSGDDVANAVTMDDAGNVFVTGRSIGVGTSQDYTTIKYNFSGNLEWIAFYDGPDHHDDEAAAIVLDNSGNVYVTGESYATQPYTPEYDYLTVMYNAAGSEQWTHRYNGTGDTQDEGVAIDVDQAGNVYVAGTSIGAIGYDDIVTIKYGATAITEDAGFTALDARCGLNASPNPFHHATNIRYWILDTGYLIQDPVLSIHDACGRLVKSFDLLSSIENQGSSIVWNGRDDHDRQLGSGVYFLRLTAAGREATERLILIR